MSEIFETCRRFLEREDWEYDALTDDGILQVGCAGDHGAFRCYFHALELRNQALFFAICPFEAPPERRRDMAELVARANWGMVLGSFDLDFEDGEVRFRVAVDLEHVPLTEDLFGRLAAVGAEVMDAYLPALQAVAEGRAEPEAAIREVEGE